MGDRRDALARRRIACGLSQEALAELVGVDRTTVARWELGTTGPQPLQRPRLAKALRLTIDECDLLLTGRDDPETDDRLRHAAHRPRAVDLGAVAVLHDKAQDLARRYDRTPSVALLPDAAYCHSQVAYLREQVVGEQVRRSLYALEAQTAALMGQLVWDASQRRDVVHANRYFDRSAAAARQTGDTGTEAYAVLRKCFVALYGVQDPISAVPLAQQAAALADTAGQTALAGLALVHLAEAHAMLGDRRACDQVLGDAQALQGADQGVLGVQFDAVQYGRLRGSCYLSLGQVRLAETVLEATSRSMDPEEKALAIVLANLALAHLRQRDLDAAAAALHRAIDIIAATRAGGGLTVVFAVGREMAPWRQEPVVQDLHDRLLGLMAA